MNHGMPGHMGQGPPLGGPGMIPGGHAMPPFYPPRGGGPPHNFGPPPQGMPPRPQGYPINPSSDGSIVNAAQMLDQGLSNTGQYFEDDDNEPLNPNTIVAQYRTESRVRQRYKFTLQNVVIFLNGVHHYVRELKAQFEF